MSELSEFLSKHPDIVCSSIYAGFELKASNDTDKWSRDIWRVTISYNGRSFSSEYSAGLGHRKLRQGVKRISVGHGKVGWARADVVARSDEEAAKLKLTEPVPPELADVLYCLLSDASGSEETFPDWCANFGYSTDSRKALEIYLKCQDTRTQLIGMLGHSLFNEMRNLEH